MKKIHLQWLMGIFGILSIVYFIYIYEISSEVKQWIFALWWPAIVFHQIEEYIIAEKILGQKYFFLNWFKDNGYNVSYSLSFFVNCIMSPVLIIIATIIAYNFKGIILMVPLTLMTIEFANANWHISFTLQKNLYSPGAITGLLVYFPLTIFIFCYFIEKNLINYTQLFVSIILGYILMYMCFQFFPKKTEDSMKKGIYKTKKIEMKVSNECTHSIEKCDILDFMAKYVGLNVLHPGGFKATNKLLKMLNINEQTSILDVACGKGTSSYYFVKKYNCNVTGIDIDENLLQYAKNLSIKKKTKDKMVFQVGDAEKLPFNDNTFDIVIFQAALVLIGDIEQAISEAVRVTKKGGKIGILELTWLKEPTEKIIESAKKDICAYCITRAKKIDGWKNLLENAGLKIKEAYTFLMESPGIGDEGIGTMLKVMFKICTNSVIRKRINKINQFFKDNKGYLGYAILVGEKMDKSQIQV